MNFALVYVLFRSRAVRPAIKARFSGRGEGGGRENQLRSPHETGRDAMTREKGKKRKTGRKLNMLLRAHTTMPYHGPHNRRFQNRSSRTKIGFMDSCLGCCIMVCKHSALCFWCFFIFTKKKKAFLKGIKFMFFMLSF